MKQYIMGLLLFAIGWVSASLVGLAMLPVESPLGEQSTELASPHDWVKQEQIRVDKEKVVLLIENAQIATFANTNSMDPLLDENSHGIEIIPQNPEDIHVGDIISYRSGSDTIIHRVVSINLDEEGYFYTLKGDNNPVEDPEKVRFEQVERLLVGIIY